MGKSGKKPRQRMNPRQHEGTTNVPKKKDDDWSFEEFARSKTRHR